MHDDWRPPPFQIIAGFEPGEPKVAIIDELPYPVEGNAALPSVLQYVWDETLSGPNVMLVLCGSSALDVENGLISLAPRASLLLLGSSKPSKGDTNWKLDK